MIRALPLLCLLGAASAVPVYVMLPLNTITTDNKISDPTTLQQQLQQLKSIGVAGFMMDVWFGICEPSPGQYNFDGYVQLAKMAHDLGLTVQAVMSFHRCGSGPGDTCNIPLPNWVLQAQDVWYKDREGNENDEYISLFADEEAVISGRSPVQIYSEFMSAFASALSDYLGSTLVEVMVGMGPSGEMRYPAYQTPEWSFCGVGEVQCYDKYALQSLAAAAQAAGHSDWGNGGPDNAGSYRAQPPSSTGFWGSGANNYASDYGQFFMQWYSKALLDHGNRVLSAARQAFPSSVRLTGKVAGIHWWYKDESHAAECTAGYWNTDQHNAYADIAAMLSKAGAEMDFTALEMQDSEQPSSCGCGPYELVHQARQAASDAGIGFSGENALARFDSTAYNTIVQQSGGDGGPKIASFTYLRLGDTLMQSQNLATFASFVKQMKAL